METIESCFRLLEKVNAFVEIILSDSEWVVVVMTGNGIDRINIIWRSG